MSRRAALLVSVLLVTAVARPAWADHDDPPMTFTRSPAEGAPGSVIEVSGTGCIYHGKPYEQVMISLSRTGRNADGQPYDHVEFYPIGPDGTFSASFGVPSEAPSGDYNLSATCYASDMAFGVGDAPFAVTAPPPPTTQPPPTTVVTAPPPPPPTTVPSTSTTAPTTATTVPPSSSSSTGSTELAGASSPSTSVPGGDDGGGGLPLGPVLGAFAALAVAGGGFAGRDRIREAVRGRRGG